MLIIPDFLIRLLTQHYYFIGTRCDSWTHYRECNYHTDRALLFFITHSEGASHGFVVRQKYTFVFLTLVMMQRITHPWDDTLNELLVLFIYNFEQFYKQVTFSSIF